MRRIAAVLASLVLGISGCDALSEATEDFSIAEEWPAAAALVIDWTAGEIEVQIDGSATGIAISGTKRVRATSEEEAALLLPGLDVVFGVSATDDDVFTLEVDPPEVTSLAQFVVDVVVTLPRGTVLNIGQGSGGIMVSDNSEATVIQSINGSIDITGLAEADVDITLQNGNIAVDSTGGNVIIQASNGSVGVNARPPANGGVAVTGINLGFVGVAVPSDFSGVVDLDVTTGVIQAFLAEFDQFDLNNVNTTPTSVTGTLGSGNGRIDVSIVSGNITVQPL
jgi:hypothetical protein